MPVLIGADEYGEKDMLAVMDGFRGYSDSWRDQLLIPQQGGQRDRGDAEIPA